MSPNQPAPSLFSRFLSLRFGFLPAALQPLSPLLVVLCAAALAIFLLGRGGGSKPVDKGDGLKRVQVVSVRMGALVAPRTLAGTLRARVESDLGFRVGGKIAERRVQAGDRVKAGTVLATLDATDFRLSRESAEAELRAATSTAHQQEIDFGRVSELRARGYSTAQAEDAKRAALDEARARLDRAKRAAALAANNEAYAQLKAEADGIVAGVFAEAGQVVAPGQAIVRLAQDGEREALVAVPEQDLDFVRKAQASAVLWSEPGRALPARLRELAGSADAGTRTFAARYAVEGLAPGAPLGMTVTLSLTPAQPPQGARVPLSALINEGKGPEVFVLAGPDNVLTRKAVSVLGFDAREALVSGGLAEGERVVTLGVHTLRAGEKVVPLPETATGG